MWGLLVSIAVLDGVMSGEVRNEHGIGCKCMRTTTGREALHPMSGDSSGDNLVPSTNRLPLSLDWCKDGYCVPSWNQHIPSYCGSCYVHGALASVQDRIKIMNAKRGFTGPDVMLGRQSFLNCAYGHGLGEGCAGGEPGDVFEFMKRYGLPDETCLPYNATDFTKYTWTANGTCPPEGFCMNCMYTTESPATPVCFAVTKVVRYKVTEYGFIRGEDAMMAELLNGPITCGIAAAIDFMENYTAGIYIDRSNAVDLDHDVEIVGWGVADDGTKFWHVRNSWGSYWGENGFFRIVRGVNNLGIESDCVYAVPDVTMEDMVWSETAVYGGSLYGLRPLHGGNDVRDSTTDVTVKLSSSTSLPAMSSRPLQVQSSWTALAMAGMVAAAVGFFAGRVSRRRSYQRIY
ncbi:hypothetical protein, variant 2 [Aphanomyces invadans]|uniref:Peptidase C1A papain C-terminal domain-containing protein n=1 Tax=Aphanomyces invadans TaxID=157072 RepID=A0A024USE3_9STRA|nr:hypothetical protein H310_00009 [Aphanomyces invadans]XP_008860808.1 hypothetical protein, variant 1 [Aphanomyces invadans]XP_008860809.1 hypothetical protein, variant 2 [Aphanomyces invadans]ETW09396.1 hypothetical protein H310_00009 [Aphanomyces invadans]ETW09397.1 hypothetical protein, variant 1 [Aphanomyces invadans]ETW09398.1 hypothetical protein, variant 2 [Aphanomyces invadans]|eukprot:XP_008860807.1 hypothetical protein H310_00009 [Aphanomyces invadans]